MATVQGGPKKESVQGGPKKESVNGGPKKESLRGGTKPPGEIKYLYLPRFEEQYKNWVDDNIGDSEIEKELKKKKKEHDHLCPKIKEKRTVKTDEDKTVEIKAEEDRMVTDSESPVQTLHGFNNEIKSLKLFLLDKKVYKEFKSLMIVGEYGVGKTALCKKIFNDEEVKSVYAPRIWVSMHSKETKEGEPKKISVVKRILKGLGAKEELFDTIHREAVQEASVNLERANNQRDGEIDRETAAEKELSALLYALHLSLRWKKYLIIFDDVRKEDQWNENLGMELKEGEKWGKFLSDGFPKGSGGRVIYTTRDEDKSLAKEPVVKKHEIHRLWPLTDITCVWKIYEDALKDNGEVKPPRNDKKCIDELMNKSRGLPLAARMVATLLPVYVDDNKNNEDETTKNATPGTAENSTEEQTETTTTSQACC